MFLAGERWARTVESLRQNYDVLTGDMLLASAFVSYAGPFTSKFRAGLIKEWITFLSDKGTPMTEGIKGACAWPGLLSSPWVTNPYLCRPLLSSHEHSSAQIRCLCWLMMPWWPAGPAKVCRQTLPVYRMEPS